MLFFSHVYTEFTNVNLLKLKKHYTRVDKGS